MSAPLRLALFAALLLAVFGGAAVAGGVVQPGDGTDEVPAAHGGAPDRGHDEKDTARPTAGTPALPGLAVAQDGLRLVVDRTTLARGDARRLSFRLLDDAGETIRAFDVNHEKRMHLIVVRRDLTGFQHLHPTMAPDGTWSAAVDVPAAGTYRAYADFTLGGEQHTLGADLLVPGDFAPASLPAAARTVTDDRGLQVTLRRDGDRFAFSVARDGRPVDDELQPYLGAKGHLVTLRAGDLAYLHTHPEGDALAFEAELPSAGRYRLWVQFRLDDRIHTAAFTTEVPR